MHKDIIKSAYVLSYLLDKRKKRKMVKVNLVWPEKIFDLHKKFTFIKVNSQIVLGEFIKSDNIYSVLFMKDNETDTYSMVRHENINCLTKEIKIEYYTELECEPCYEFANHLTEVAQGIINAARQQLPHYKPSGKYGSVKLVCSMVIKTQPHKKINKTS